MSIDYPSFNYIGSKTKLLGFLKNSIEDYTKKSLVDTKSFSDLFSGTGIVSYYMISQGIKKVITNDLQYYSYIVSSILTKQDLDIQKLSKVIDNLNSIDCTNPSDRDFIYSNYTPNGNCQRMFLTNENGLKVDRIRRKIEESKSVLNLNEYNCLLKLLLYAVTKVSNTSSTYGAYLKRFKDSAKKTLYLDVKLIDKLNDKEVDHFCFNQNVLNYNFDKVEICYLDPPYNSRKYSRNYDLLETIAKYDNPEIKGITGLRVEDTINTFCSKTTAVDDFTKLFNHVNADHIFLSYSSEGLLSKDEIIKLLEIKWKDVVCYEQEYKRFKSNKNGEQNKTVIEYLFAGKIK
jgi:adenine-specific DNA-methyltransferase